MKRIRNYGVVAMVTLFLLAGCGTAPQKNEERVAFVSILPLKYFADKIAGERFKTEVLVPPGVGPETYAPTPKQIGSLSQASLLFVTGHMAFEEAWKEGVQSVSDRLLLVNTSEGVDLIGEEVEHGDHTHLHGVDPHTWSSPAEAKIVARNIYDGFMKADPGHGEIYQQNFDRLLAEIDSVEKQVGELLAGVEHRKFLIFHPALGYLARQYQLEQLAIEFDGKNPTPRHMQTLVQQIKSSGIDLILMQKEFDKENAEVLAKETGIRIVEIDPLDYQWREQMVSMAKKIAGKE